MCIVMITHNTLHTCFRVTHFAIVAFATEPGSSRKTLQNMIIANFFLILLYMAVQETSLDVASTRGLGNEG